MIINIYKHNNIFYYLLYIFYYIIYISYYTIINLLFGNIISSVWKCNCIQLLVCREVEAKSYHRWVSRCAAQTTRRRNTATQLNCRIVVTATRRRRIAEGFYVQARLVKTEAWCIVGLLRAFTCIAISSGPKLVSMRSVAAFHPLPQHCGAVLAQPSYYHETSR